MNIEVIRLRKDVLKEPYLKDEGLAVYAALRQRKEHTIDYESYQHIAYLLSGEIESNADFIKKVKKGLENLADLELIKVISATKRGIELDTSPLHFSTTSGDENFANFFIVKRTEITRIFTADDNKYPMKMLRYFCCIIDSISNGSDSINYQYWKNVGCHAVSKLAELAHISESTALDYNRFLEHNNLITISRAPEGIVDENGKIINGLTNCYGRPEHTQTIKDFQSKRIEACSFRTAPFGKKTNKKRSMKQKYNELVQGKDYSQPELREMQEHFEKMNSKYDKGITEIAQKYNHDEISFEQYEVEVNRYQETHEKIDLTPITEKLTDDLLPQRKSSSHVRRKLCEEDDDSLYDFFNYFSSEKNTEIYNTKNDDEALFKAALVGYRVNEGLAGYYSQMLKKGMLTETSIRYDLKRTHGCDAELIEQYMAALENCDSQEYDAVI